MPYKNPEDKKLYNKKYHKKNYTKNCRKEYFDKYTKENKEILLERSRRFYMKNYKEIYKKSGYKKHLRRKYNLTEEDYTKMFLQQDGKCNICSQISDKKLYVDHCHETGKVRGLLCRSCNTGIGCFKDNLNLLDAAKTYLIRTANKYVTEF